jgi:nucleotide-binding universal stress UspA family protein
MEEEVADMPMEPTGPVVVGADGSPASLEAVDLAAEEAVARVAPLVVVHVRDDIAPSALSDVRVQRLLDVATARAMAEHPGLSVSGVLATGKAGDVLNGIAGMSLLVVGHRGSGGGPHAAWTVGRILQKAAVPVIVHRPFDCHDVEVLPRPVLVGVAANRCADDVLAFAFAEAALRGAPLLAMRVWGQQFLTEPDGAGQTGEGADPAEADRSLNEALASWAEKYPEVAVARVVHQGLDVALPLVTASRAAQLAVVGSHHGRPAWPAQASVSRFLIRRAHCPVAVVPNGDIDAGWARH